MARPPFSFHRIAARLADPWGPRPEQLFMQFHGPSQILLQTRGARLRDVLTARDVNEIADTEPGALQPAVTLKDDPAAAKASRPSPRPAPAPTTMSYASVGEGGRVKFERS